MSNNENKDKNIFLMKDCLGLFFYYYYVYLFIDPSLCMEWVNVKHVLGSCIKT